MGVPPGSRSLMYCKSKGPSFFISKKKGNKFVRESTYSYIYIYCTNTGNLAAQFLFVPHLLKIRIIFIQSTHTGEVRHLTRLEVIWFDLRVKSRQTDQSQGLFGQQFCSWYYKGVPLTRHFAQSRNPDGFSWHTSSRIPHPALIGTLRSEDGDGSENVAEKVNSRSFNLYRDYSKSLTLSNVGELS